MKKSILPLSILSALGLSTEASLHTFAEPLPIHYVASEGLWRVSFAAVIPGTASRTVSYNTPGGTAAATFSLGYDANGIVTWVKVSKAGGDATSGAYINMFAEKIAGAIVGKNAKSLSVGTVGGASLTSGAFRQFAYGISPKSATTTTTTTTKVPTTTKTTTPTKIPTAPKPVTPPSPVEYKRTVRYTSPGGKPEMSFSLTIDPKGKITDVGAIPVSGDQESARYGVQFIKDLKKAVIGKNIKTLSLSAVGGATLTTKAFNQYINVYNTGKASENVTGVISQKISLSQTLFREVSYSTPGGISNFRVALKVDPSGMIHFVNTRAVAGSRPETLAFVKSFGKLINRNVKGKNIASLKIATIGGSSLTTKAFSEVVENIRNVYANLTPATPVKAPVTATGATQPPPTATGSVATDITVTKSITYTTPGGSAQVSFSLIKDASGIIKSISATKIAGDATSSAFISLFSSEISLATIGKNINSLSLSAVGGASLTTGAFSQFLVTARSATAPIIPTLTVATAPQGVTAIAGDGQATISFSPPSDSGGSAITSYTVRSSGGQTAVGTTSPITVIGLSNGTSYTFTVTATNAQGTSTASLPSVGVTPKAPTPPVGTTTTSNQTLTYTTPGGSAQVAFSLAKDANGVIQSVTATKVSGDTTSSAFIQMFASSISSVAVGKNINSLSLSAVGGASLTTGAFNQFIAPLRTTTVTPTVTTPGAPTSVSAVAGDASALVYFTAPSSNGGATITGYTVRSSGGTILATGTTSPISITGLSNGTTYIVNVAATNSAGSGPTSANSNSFTPTAPVSSTTTGGGTTTSTTQTASQSVTYSVPGNTATANFILTYNSSNGVIQSASATIVSGNSESASFISRFNTSVSASVVGVAINAIPTLSRVGGASLTTPAFNQFAATLKTMTFSGAGTATGGNTSSGATSSGTTTTVTPQTYTLGVDKTGNYATTSATLNVGDSINFIYTPPYLNEIITVFSPVGPYANFTMDKDITSKKVTFITAGTWTIKAKDYSGNTVTITVK